MRDELANLVFPVVARGLALRDRVERGERPDMITEQNELRGLLRTLNEAQRWPDYSGDGEHFLGIRYALVCWLDEVFILDSPWGDQWNEHKLEESLYGSNDRAWKFWVQAERAEARPTVDALEAYYLCVMLGFRGENHDRPERLRAWCDSVGSQLRNRRTQEFPGPQGKPVEGSAAPRRGRERLRLVLHVLMALVGMLLLAGSFALVISNKAS